MPAGSKILIVVTNHANYPDGTKTGLWLSEFVHFYDVLELAGYKIDVASPRGGEIPIDPLSLHLFFSDLAVKEFQGDAIRMDLLNNTLPVATLNPDDYSCVYFAGGHGTMFDFPGNETIDKLVIALFEQGKIVSAVCHGPAALLNARLSNGTLLLKGKRVTGFSWFEELLANRRRKVPFNLEREIRDRGAEYKNATFPFSECVIVDGNLVTGQNPQSSKGVARVVLQNLQQMR